MQRLKKKCSQTLTKGVKTSLQSCGGFDIFLNLCGTVPVLAPKGDKYQLAEWIGEVGTIDFNGKRYAVNGYARFFIAIPKTDRVKKPKFKFEGKLPPPTPSNIINDND